MNSSHRRPLVAYVLVSVAGAVVVAQGLAGLGLPSPLTPFLDLDPARQQVADGGLLVETPRDPAVSPETDGPADPGGSILDGDAGFDDDTLTLGTGTPAPAPAPESPDGAVSAAPQPGKADTGPVRSNLVGPGSSSDDGPELGSPAQGAPGAEAPAEGEEVDGDSKPAPHSFSDTDPKAHPYGTAQPPRGQAKGHDKVRPSKPATPAEQPQADPEKEPRADKPAKEPRGTSQQDKSDKSDKGKSAKGTSGKGLSKGQGKVKPGARGKKHR